MPKPPEMPKKKQPAIKRPKSDPIPSGKCVACGGTGKASNGGPCYPCNVYKPKD